MLERVNYLWLAFAERVASAASPQNLNFFRRPWNFGDETSRNVNFGAEATSHIVRVSKKKVSKDTNGIPSAGQNVGPKAVERCIGYSSPRIQAGLVRRAP